MSEIALQLERRSDGSVKFNDNGVYRIEGPYKHKNRAFG
jgi:hypothetical protein